jgi:ADP-ribose pyrophosphatase YjhB (NUDIX family)
VTRLHVHFESRVPEGEDRERAVCGHCGYVAYRNPKIVAGAVVEHGGRILLCRRAIPPREGYWTLPAGYLELGESPEEGARREALEEARADLVLDGLLAVYTIRRLSQVQLFYRARLASGGVGAGPESLEVAFFEPDAMPPREEIAFPSVLWALEHAAEARRVVAGGGVWAPAGNPVGRDEGIESMGERPVER